MFSQTDIRLVNNKTQIKVCILKLIAIRRETPKFLVKPELLMQDTQID